MAKQRGKPSYVSPAPPDDAQDERNLQEVEKQRDWANKMHDGEHQREARTRGKGKPTPNKRKGKS